jgi:urea transporter
MLTPAIAGFGVKTLSAPFVLTTWLMLWLGWVEQNWFVLPPALTSSAAGASKPDGASLPTQSHLGGC